ncbi:MMPL family transporter [Cellulomonas bogoriensis]|nr:MMPL family transporter [Cellulomonas bogoriensis]
MLSNRSWSTAVLRGAVVVAVLLAWLAAGGAGGVAIGNLSDVQQNDAAAFLPEGAESTRAAEAARAFVEDTTLPAIVVSEAEAPLSPEQVATIMAFAERVPDLPVGQDGTVGDLLTGTPVAIPAEDGLAVMVVVPLDAERANAQNGEDRAVNAVVDSLRDAVDADLDLAGVTTWVTGPAAGIADLVAAFAGIDGLLLVVALAVVLVILVVVYRSPSLPITVLATSMLALTLAALVVYRLAEADVLVLNGQSQGILFILVVGAATDYSLLIVSRYRDELRLVESPYTAMRRALRATIEPVAASAGTVIAGVLCLLLSDLTSNSSLGPVAAVGIVSAFLAATTLLPALLLIAGRWSRLIFWPRVPRPGAAVDRVDETAEQVEARSGAWGRISAAIARRPRRTWVLTAAVLLLLTAWVPTFQAQGTSESDVFLTEVDSVAGEQALARHFDAGGVQPVVVVGPEADAGALVTALTAVDGVVGAEVTADEDGAPVVVDGRVRIEAVTTQAPESQEALDVVVDIRDTVRGVSPGSMVGGVAAERVDTLATAGRDLVVIVPVVLVVILVVLIGLLRSVVAPLLLMGANLLSFGATLGIGALVFNHVFGFPGADPTVPLYAFVFLVALGIDYSIFLMTRVREEALVHGTRDGVRRGLSVTGGVITSAGIVLAATFGALAVLPLLFLVQLAFLVALGVLIDALVVRTLLVPALVHDVGRASWWPWQNRIRD